MKYFAWFLLAFMPLCALAADETTVHQSKRGLDNWSLSFGLSQVIGSGSFSQNEYIRASNDYVGQSFNLGFAYKGLEILEQPIQLSLKSSMDLEWTAPTHGGRRRLILNDTRVSAVLPDLWTEPLSGMGLSLKTSIVLPTSISSYQVKKQLFVATFGANAAGQWGIFSLDLGLQFSKYFGATIGRYYGISPAGCGLPTSASVEEFTPDCSAEMVRQQEGFPNVSAAIGASIALGIELFDHLSLTYGLGVRSYFKYSIAQDNWTSVHASAGVGRRDYFSPSWTLSYPLSRKFELPLDFSVFVDASAFHSVRSADDKRIFAPLVFNTFGQLAADGYGSLSMGVSGNW